MFDVGSIEREIYDKLMLDRKIRAKFDPQELEDLITDIAAPFKIQLENAATEIKAFSSLAESTNRALGLMLALFEARR